MSLNHYLSTQELWEISEPLAVDFANYEYRLQAQHWEASLCIFKNDQTVLYPKGYIGIGLFPFKHFLPDDKGTEKSAVFKFGITVIEQFRN